jgi:hypothetical protein
VHAVPAGKSTGPKVPPLSGLALAAGAVPHSMATMLATEARQAADFRYIGFLHC